MKRIVRIIAVVLCAAMLGIILCSCEYLDEKKANHAVYCDETKDSFTFRGYTYQTADIPEDLIFIPVNSFSKTYVTEKDVPVMLSTWYGEKLRYDLNKQNPIIIQIYSSQSYYIREDQYVSATYTFNNPVYDHYYLDDNSSEIDYDSVGTNYTLISNDTTNAINDTLDTGEEFNYTDFGDDVFEALNIYQCDKNLLITNNRGVTFLKKGDSCYLVPIKNEKVNSDVVVKVPEKYVKGFIKQFEEHESMVYETTMYERFDKMSELVLSYLNDATSSSDNATG